MMGLLVGGPSATHHGPMHGGATGGALSLAWGHYPTEWGRGSNNAEH